MSCFQGCDEQPVAQCPPECNCTSNDIVYNGANDICTNVKYGSFLTDVLTKIATFAKNRLYSIIGSNSIKVTPMQSTSCNKSVGLDVILSPDANNQLTIKSNGLYAQPTPIPDPPPAYVPDYKVKVDDTDTPDYLVQQVDGTTDGIVTISVVDTNGKLIITPSLNITALLNKVRDSYGDDFCALVATCINYAWVQDTYNCESADLDLMTVKTITSLPNPVYTFEDNGRLYFVSGANNVGKIWSIDPAIATSVSDIVYLKETRSGQPYGSNGGTYTANTNYTANASGTGASIIVGVYYDKPTRTLYIHGNRSYGCDYYDFSSGTWSKISVGSTGSLYNTTIASDYYTHIAMSSNPVTDVIVTGWGTNSTDRGSRVITISKSSKSLIAQVDTTVTSTFAGITGNPFNHSWGAYITSDNRLFIAKANVSSYRNVAVFNNNLTPIVEIVLSHSTLGFNSDSSYYWQNGFIDVTNNKFYNNDFMSRTMEVYDTTTYALLKTFTFDNNRSYTTAQAYLDINSVTSDLYCDIIYGGTNQTISDDAPANELISYKINRSTLDIEKIYTGVPKAASLTPLDNGDVVTTKGGDVNPISPTTTGYAVFQQKDVNGLKNGMVDVLTLKEVNSSTNVPTGNTKPNVSTDPDYIAPYRNTTLCPVSYTLASPEYILLTVTPSRYSIEFGLNDDVVLNPVLHKIVANITGSAGTIASITWTIPNTPSTNAFYKYDVINSGVTVGDTITVNLQYLDSNNSPVATYNGIKTFTAVATV